MEMEKEMETSVAKPYNCERHRFQRERRREIEREREREREKERDDQPVT